MDPEMAKMMGFSGFGGGKDKSSQPKRKKPEGKGAKWGASLRRDAKNPEGGAGGGDAPGAVQPSGAAMLEQKQKRHEKYAVGAPEAPAAGRKLTLPITHTAQLSAHAKPVSALAIDPTAQRLLTGGLDYRVNIWQFTTMDSSLRSMKSHEPHEGYPINDLSFSPSGERYVASINHLRPLIFSRDGKELSEFVAGDVYVLQENTTRGHTGKTTTVRWAADDENLIISAALDGTVRLWDPENVEKRQKEVFLHGKRLGGGRKPHCTFADLNGPRKAIVTGGADGYVNVWGRAGPFTRPSLSIDAHGAGNIVTSIASSADGRFLVSRGEEGSVKLWDTRNAKEPVHQRNDLEAFYDNTSVVFGHGDQVIATGTAADPREGEVGNLVLMSALDLSTVASVPVGVGSVSQVVWHPTLNQIFVGSQDGNCHVFYNPVVSNKGIVMPLQKQRQRQVASSVQVGEVICPESEKDLRDALEAAENPRKHAAKKARADVYKPESKVPQAKAGGSVTSKQAFLRQFLPDMISKTTMRDEDPRAALLRHAQEAEANPQYIDTAYTEPKVFAEPEKEDSEAKNKKRPFSAVGK